VSNVDSIVLARRNPFGQPLELKLHLLKIRVGQGTEPDESAPGVFDGAQQLIDFSDRESGSP